MHAPELFNRQFAALGGGAQGGGFDDAAQECLRGLAERHGAVVVGHHPVARHGQGLPPHQSTRAGARRQWSA